MNLYESTGDLPKNLNLLQRALLATPSTSLESDRCFSMAKMILTNLRNWMSHDIVDAICFMKAFYKNQKQDFFTSYSLKST